MLGPQGPDAQLLDRLLQSHFSVENLPWVLAYGDVRQGAAFIATLRKVLNRAACQLAEQADSPWLQALGADFAAFARRQSASALARAFLCSGLLAELTWLPSSSPAHPLLVPSSAPAASAGTPSTTSAPEHTPQPTPPRAATHGPAEAASAHEPGTELQALGTTLAAAQPPQPAVQGIAAQASGQAPAPPVARGPGLDLCAVPAGRQRLTLLLTYAGLSLAPPMATYLLQAADVWAKLAGSGSGSRPGRAQKRGPQASRTALQPLHQRSLLSDADLSVLWPPVLSWLTAMAMECVHAAQHLGQERAEAGAAGTGAGGASSSSSASGSGSAMGACGEGASAGSGAGGGGREGAGRGEGAGGSGGGGGEGVRPGLRAVSDACRQMALHGMGAIGLVGAALRQTISLAVKEPPGCEKVMLGLAAALCCVAAAFPEEVRQAVRETAHLAGAAGGTAGGGGGAVRSKAAAKKTEGGSRSGDASARVGGGDGALAAVSGEVWPSQLVSCLGACLRSRQQQQQDGLVNYCTLVEAFRALEALLQLWGTGRGLSEGGEGQVELQRAHVEGVAVLRATVRAMGWVPRAPLHVGGVHVGPGELRAGLLRTCAFPACVNVEGDSEVGAEGRLLACARGCGAAWYCSRACMEGHWVVGHDMSCGGVRLV